MTIETNKENVELKESIVYTVKINNEGDTNAVDVFFRNEWCTGTVLVVDSIMVDGIANNNQALESGIDLGTIIPEQEVIIQYEIRIIGGVNNQRITNEAYAIYYKEIQDNSLQFEETNHVSVCICLTINYFKQIILDQTVALHPTKPDIENVQRISGSIQIEDYYVVRTIKGMSEEGQILSGYLLGVTGKLNLAIIYTALLQQELAYYAEAEIPFGTFVVLPMDYNGKNQLQVFGTIEEIIFSPINCREISINVPIIITVE